MPASLHAAYQSKQNKPRDTNNLRQFHQQFSDNGFWRRMRQEELGKQFSLLIVGITTVVDANGVQQFFALTFHKLVQISLDLHSLSADTVRLIPVNFGKPYCAIKKPYSCTTLEFSPTTSTKTFLQR